MNDLIERTAEQERAAIVAWLRDESRRQFVPMPDTVIPGYYDDEYDKWVPQHRRPCSRLPNHKDYADAIERGDHHSGETNNG